MTTDSQGNIFTSRLMNMEIFLKIVPDFWTTL